MYTFYDFLDWITKGLLKILVNVHYTLERLKQEEE